MATTVAPSRPRTCSTESCRTSSSTRACSSSRPMSRFRSSTCELLRIFSSNLDEFFQVRVAGLLGQAESGIAMRSADGLTPQQALARIRERVLELTTLQSKHLETGASPRTRGRGIVVGGMDDLGQGARPPREPVPPRDLPRAHAPRRRPGTAVPVHFRACRSRSRSSRPIPTRVRSALHASRSRKACRAFSPSPAAAFSSRSSRSSRTSFRRCFPA